MRKLILALLILLMAVSVAAADTIYLRDGRTIRGTVLGYINGRFAVRLASTQNSNNASTRPSDDTGEIVFLRPRDVERVEIEGRSLDEARYQTRTVQVALGPNWIDSGVDVRRGQRIQVSANGTIYAGRTRITPDGLRTTDPNAPLPRAAEGVLIGTVGTDPSAPIMELGLNREFVADRDGRLYLTANRSEYTDARGSYNVRVRTELDFTPRNASNRNTNNRSNDDDDNDAFGTISAQNNPAPVRPRTGGVGTAASGGSYSTNRTTREATISVPGNSRGTDTGIDLRSGDQVTITASGSITAGRRAGVVSPEGGRTGIGSVIGTYPVPQAGVGALIGYIRLPNGQITQPFFVGSQQTFSAPVDGRLVLLVNDDNYNDNSGEFSVRVVY
jgi:hypothetical protein